VENKTVEWWDRYFLQMAKHVSTASKDPSAKIGAVIVNELRQVVGMGYNGFPRGIADDERWNNREVKLQHVVHAEMNAIQAGIKGIVGYNADMNNPRVERWRASIAISAGMWEEVGNFIRSYDE
jgi:dCMP deaminase